MEPKTTVLTILTIGLAFSSASAGETVPAEAARPAPEPEQSFTLFPIPEYGGDLGVRAALTGDWGGSRTSLSKDAGLQFEVNAYNHYQGVVSGGSSHDWEYSGITDYIIKYDTGQGGLWPGGFLYARGQSYFGEGITGNTGGIVPVNTQFALRLPADSGTYLPHLYFTQFISPKTAFAFGKLDGTLGDTNAFAHAIGNNRFMNLAFNFNPVLLKTGPYAPLGASVMVFPTKDLALKFFAFDTEGQIDRAGFDTLFNGGTTFLGDATVTTNFFNQAGHHDFIYSYTNQDSNSVQQDPRLILPAGSVVPTDVSSSWAFTYNFDQYLVSHPDDPARGWGPFGRFGVSDGKANLIKEFYSVGLGGTGLIPGREKDRFGVGYYHLNLASDRSDLVLGNNENGMEIFYNLVPASWIELTANLQVIDGAVKNVDTATVVGFRGSITF